MSDVIPQCITCKFNPCKWFNKKEREKTNISYNLCKYFKETNFAIELYKNIDEIINE